MKISINASPQLANPSLAGLQSHAAQAAADGFAGWWMAQSGNTEALTVFTAVARAAPDIEFGTAVIPTYTRHPSTLAAQALTTQAAVGGRLTLGIGVSHKPAVEDRWGMSFERPIRHLLDYLAILEPLLNEGHVAYRGEVFTTVTDPAGRITDDPPSIMLAALGPQMLDIAGRRTEGTILWMVGPRTIAEHIAPRISDAAAAADRPAPRVLCSLPVAVTDDVDQVREFAHAALERYGALPSYRAMLDREGASTPADVAIFGSEEEVTDKLMVIKDAGATDFSAVEFALNDDDAARTRAVLKSLR